MRLQVSKVAEQDLDEIFVYWAKRAGLEVADRLVDSIADRFALIAEYPSVGRDCDEIAPGMLCFLAGKYWIYYRKKRSVLHILHVFHGARDQAQAFSRKTPR